MTDCQCSHPGWCERHKMRKTPHWYHLCQTRDDYFRAWEDGRGPGQVAGEGEVRSQLLHGPGSVLRKMLGCSAKGWRHYSEMDKLGEACGEHIAEFAQKLSEYPKAMCCSLDAAEKLIRSAVKTWKESIDAGRTERRMAACVCCARYVRDGCELIGDGGVQAFKNAITNGACPLGRWSWSIRWVSYVDMANLANSLLHRIPDDIGAVLGVPRSGMMAGALIATALHLPLYTLQGRAVVAPAGGGFRSPEHVISGRMLVVDDSVSTGFCLADAANHARTQLACETVTCGLYVDPDTPRQPDIVGKWLPSPHWFEWNIMNAFTTKLIAVDMDGVLCQDTHYELLGGDETGLSMATALTVPKTFPVKSIITARMHRNRQLTEEWLARRGAMYSNLVCGPWNSPDERTFEGVVQFKADAYKSSSASLFIESDDTLSQKVAQASKRPVLCWDSKTLYEAKSDNRPTIVFLTTVFRVGGVEHWILSMCRAASEKRRCVIAILNPNEVDGLMVKEAYRVADVVQGKECLEACVGAELLVTWGGVGTFDVARRRHGRTLFVSHLGGELGRITARHWERLPMEWAAVSEPAANACPVEVSVIVPHGVDVSRVSSYENFSRVTPSVGYVGRLHPSKNFLAAAKAARTIGCEAIYQGYTPSWSDRQALLSACDNLTLLPASTNVGPAYGRMHVFVQASPCETGPLTTLEAMYCGCRVVSTPVGMLDEMERAHGKLAERVGVNPSETELADAALRAMEDDETWRHAQEVVREHYTLEKSMGRWMEVCGVLH